jgi:hypothetical protein
MAGTERDATGFVRTRGQNVFLQGGQKGYLYICTQPAVFAAQTAISACHRPALVERVGVRDDQNQRC